MLIPRREEAAWADVPDELAAMQQGKHRSSLTKRLRPTIWSGGLLLAKGALRQRARGLRSKPGDFPGRRPGKVAEPADKPGPVVDSHSSRRIVTDTLKQPTRRHRGPRHRLPIWPCSRWGLPCRSVAGLAVRSYRTVSPLPRIPKDRSAVCSLLHFPSARAAQALPGTVPCGARTFLGIRTHRSGPMTRLSGRLRRRHCRMQALHACGSRVSDGSVRST